MLRVFLLNPPTKEGHFIRTGRWTRKSRGQQQWQPVWLAYCCGLLQRRGHKVLLLDAEADGLSFTETLKRIQDFNPELAVIYFCQDSMKNDVDFGLLVEKLFYLNVVFVGPSAEFFKKELLSKGVKLLARGEFDYTVLELAEGKSMKEIKGLSWLEGTIHHHNEQRKLCEGKQLEEDFPFVTSIYKQFLDLNNYRQASFKHPFIDLFTGRGCDWGLCTFCLWAYGFNQGSRKYRVRSVHDVIEELKYIKKEYPKVKQVFFQDETMPDKRMSDISNAILNAKLKVCWGAYVRPEISDATLKVAKKSDCRTLHVGFESRNLESLKAVRKGISVERMEQFAKDVRKVGIWTSSNFILGLPHDTEEGIRKTVKWVKHKIRPNLVSFAYLQVYRGTPIYDWLKERGCLVNDKYPNYPYLSYEKIRELEKWALKEYYLKNPRWLLNQLRSPREWRGLWNGFVGFVQFFREPMKNGKNKECPD